MDNQAVFCNYKSEIRKACHAPFLYCILYIFPKNFGLHSISHIMEKIKSEVSGFQVIFKKLKMELPNDVVIHFWEYAQRNR